jgi:hypothetical protein
MPLDPVLAQGVAPINFAGPDPATKMNQLAAMMKMQSLQQEGQLNSLKLTEAQRDMADVEGMRDAIRKGADFRDVKIAAQYGAKGLAMHKALVESDNTDLDNRTKLVTAGRDIWAGVRDQASYDAALPQLEALRPGSTASLPRAFDPTLVEQNLMDAKTYFEVNKPQTTLAKLQAELAKIPLGDPRRPAYEAAIRKETHIAPTEAGQPPANVRTAQWYMNASDEERKAFDLANRPSDSNKPPSGYRYGEDGNLVAIPGGPGDVKVIGAAADARRNSELKPPPAPVSKALLENNQNLRKARDALTLIQGGKVGALQGDPNATGLKGFAPDFVLQRMDPAGIDTRAAIADLGSMIIHDRSGAAVTASEYPRLIPFIPRDKDEPPVVEKKLQRFVQEYEAIQKDYADMYSEDQGYRLPKSLTGSGGNPLKQITTEAEYNALPPGPYIDPNGVERIKKGVQQ